MPDAAGAGGLTADAGRPTLRRALGTAQLTLYGVGSIVGAGIYVLIGEAASALGPAAWLAFAASAALASLTALSYAELAARYPVSGSEAAYVSAAFGRPFLAFLAGWLIALVAVFSAAAVARGFGGYLRTFVDAPAALSAALFVAAMTAVNVRGVAESSAVNVVCTVVELAGLALVIGLALAVGRAPEAGFLAVPGAEGAGPLALATGPVAAAAGVAFFAYLGFTDVANLAEEAREPERSVPRAMLLALGISAALYVATALAAVSLAPWERLAASEAPLAEAVRGAGAPVGPRTMAAVALVSVANTGLVSLLLGSRMLYGMARQGLAPAWLAGVLGGRRTPHRASLVVGGLAAALALSGGLRVLAEAADFLIFAAFALVNAALLAIKLRERRGGGGPAPRIRAPLWAPALGAAASLWMLTRLSASAFAVAAAFAGAGAGLRLAWRRGSPD